MFASFFLAGFECATGFNRHRQWFDQVAATCHDRRVEEDFARLREVGILAAREAVRWPLVDRRGRYDFSTVQPFLDAARRHRITLIHDLFHFGYPEDVDLMADDFPRRFADYCHAAARYIAARSEGVCYFTPINEPSYFSWAAGEAGLFAPHLTGRGWELKVRLIRAAIAGIDAIRDACPRARIVNVDPICHVTAPCDRPDLEAEADHFNRHVVFQGWDMLSGRLLPELGGSPSHLDIVGVNYYWTNQWELGGGQLAEDDPRRVPLGRLLMSVWRRYGAEFLITETSHREARRAGWLMELTDEAESLLIEGVPLGGICLYPILGMPEWHAPHEWTRMGLWDIVECDGSYDRRPCEPMLAALRHAQRRLAALHRSHSRPFASEPALARAEAG